MHKGILPLALAVSVLAFGTACSEVGTGSSDSSREDPISTWVSRRSFSRLMMACAFNDVGTAQYILASGVPLELNKLDQRWNNTPLNRAASHGYTSIVVLLLGRGADPNVPGGLGQLPLMSAADGGHLETVRVLLKHGAVVDGKTDQFDATPLMRAARYGHVDVVRVLLASGASVGEVSAAGVTALLLARRYHHKEVENLLLAAGAGSADTVGESDTTGPTSPQGPNFRMQRSGWDKVQVEATAAGR